MRHGKRAVWGTALVMGSEVCYAGRWCPRHRWWLTAGWKEQGVTERVPHAAAAVVALDASCFHCCSMLVLRSCAAA